MHRHSSHPENTAPPSPLPTTSSRIHTASVGLLSEDEELSGRQRTEQQATASARTAAQPHPPPMSLRQDGAHASRMAPHSAGAQQMVLGASPRAAATSLPARVLHEAYGTGTALGGAMGDASTAGDSATGGAKAAASRATEDMHTLIRALKTDLSCMSVRLERLEALLSA